MTITPPTSSEQPVTKRGHSGPSDHLSPSEFRLQSSEQESTKERTWQWGTEKSPPIRSPSASAMAMSDEEILRRIDEATTNARRIQQETLSAILERNSRAAYLQPHLFGRPAAEIDVESFRRLVPLSSYDDYDDLIRLIADGVEPPSALSFDPLLCFFYSSGTSTMRPKMIPFFDSSLAKSASTLSHQGSSALLRRAVPPRQSTNKILWFLYAGNVTETKGGFKVMAASAYPFHSRSSNPSALLSMCISPPEVILGSDPHQQTYCHLLCGLKNSSLIDGIRAPYAAGLVRAINLLKSKWEQLCNDIEHGSVSSEITDISMREAIKDFIGPPRPDIAERIRQICNREKWHGVLGELWPEVCYIACVTTGSMEQYYSTLKYYAGESIPLLGGDYFASECSVGINMDRTRPPEDTSFVILPAAAYFEFLPFELGAFDEGKEATDISGVEVGKMYEVVVTTNRGLYRYQLGDVVKVVGFYNSSPRVEFVTRTPKVDSEVFTERDLMVAMEKIQLLLQEEEKGEVVEFAGFLDRHLIVFVELREGSVLLGEELEELVGVVGRCCLILEGGLGSVYKLRRERGELGGVEISVVNPGSFDRVANVAMEAGAPPNQYKPPKILRSDNLVNLLKASVVVTVNLDGP